MASEKNTYINLDNRKGEILTALKAGWRLVDIESRFDFGRSGRISKWLKLCYGRTFAELRAALKDNTTAITYGEVYYLSASEEMRADIAMSLELAGNPDGVKEMPQGPYHIWLFEDLVCVSCTRLYGTQKGIWQKLYHTRIDTANYPSGKVSIRLSANLDIPIIAEDIASQFGLLWLSGLQPLARF